MLTNETFPLQISVGVDEVGNGAVFGPICVAAVTNLTGWSLAGITDSKLIKSEKKRKVLASEIRHNTIWTMGCFTAAVVNEFGAGRALDFLQSEIIKAHVGRLRSVYPSSLITVNLDGEGESSSTPDFKLVRTAKADSLFFDVSCASILAKVCVDDWMNDIVQKEAGMSRYKVNKNKGYGTPEHKAALIDHGLTIHHRTEACNTMITGKKK